MNKEFIPYEEAAALKELGFEEPCFGWYCMNKKQLYPISPLDKNFVDTALAPLYQQAFRWFREKKKLDGEVVRYNLLNIEKKILGLEVKYIYLTAINGVALDWEDLELTLSTYYLVREEAELACLRKLIEIVKQR